MLDEWEISNVVIHLPPPDGEVVERDSISAEELSTLAKQHGLRKFIVKWDGEIVSPSDFPVSGGEIYIEEYNK